MRGKDGEPWWVAVDVCRVLGLDQVSRALSRLDEDEKPTLTIGTGLTEQGVSDNTPGTSLNLVNEHGRYRLILTSRKSEAEHHPESHIKPDTAPRHRSPCRPSMSATSIPFSQWGKDFSNWNKDRI